VHIFDNIFAYVVTKHSFYDYFLASWNCVIDENRIVENWIAEHIAKVARTKVWK